ncbi:Ankyrin repeat family protein [Forsythia ovata]|uniref:Ankyrin repeat family protein n=1 Tax=Forsythia ovata TaxID=205694 RepID=A0ABD1V0D3_9LAMI
MDPNLYRAAQEGNLHALREKKELFSTQLTPNKNTPLHVVAQFNDSPECIEEILVTNESLLYEVNSDGDTALHIAARIGKCNAGLSIIKWAKRLDEQLELGGGALKKLLTMINRNGDTALHEAIRNDQPKIVQSILEKLPEIANIVNNSLETPLFLAVDRSRVECVKNILVKCPSPAYTGPEGRTALHAVARYNCKQIVEVLLKKHPTLIKEVDDFGWSALHYAARYRTDKVAKELLNADKSIAYIVAEKDNNKTALHIATCKGNVKIMEEILTYCPDCWEMVTSDGQNILHLAVEFEKQEAFDFILKKSWVDNLINQMDDEGNTPLHVYAATPDIYGRALIHHPQADKNVVNKKNMTPLDVVEYSDVYSTSQNFVMEELKKKGATMGFWNPVIHENALRSQEKKSNPEIKRFIPTDIRKIADTHMVVAALITTVAFAAGFTIPGGYESNDGPNQGLAILSRKAAFKVFIISDTVAMVCSAAAVFLHIIGGSFVETSKLVNSYAAALILVMVAMGAMVIAFMTGLYTVLEHSLGLAIIECVICSFCFPVFYYSVKRAFINQ